MPSIDRLEPIPGPAVPRCMLTPLPVEGGVLLPRQDGTLECREASGLARWRVHAFPPDTSPASAARMQRFGASSVLLDDADKWTRLSLTTGETLWGPTSFGALRLARRGDSGLYWNYVPTPDGQVLASLDPASGAIREAGHCDRWGFVLQVESGAVLVLEGNELVRRDERTAGELWSRQLRLGPGGRPAAVDAAGCFVAGPGLIMPVVRSGFTAVDWQGQPVWSLVDDAVFSVALAGEVLHMVSPERYLRVEAASGRVLDELDMERAASSELRQVHSVTVLGDTILAADLTGLVFRLDLSSRSLTWTFRANDRIPAGCPLSIGAGQLWAMDLSGDVYGFTLPAEQGPRGRVAPEAHRR